MRTYHFCVLNALQPNVMRQVKYKRRTSPLIKARISNKLFENSYSTRKPEIALNRPGIQSNISFALPINEASRSKDSECVLPSVVREMRILKISASFELRS